VFFWRNQNGIYINNGGGQSSVQGVLEAPTRQAKSQKYNYRKGKSIPRQEKGFDHQIWVPYTKVILLALSHHSEWYFALSNNCSMDVSVFLNSLLFRSFHTSQTDRRHNNWRNARCAFEIPDFYFLYYL